MKKSRRLPAAVLLLALQACTLPVLQNPIAAPAQEGILFRDDFSDPRSGWDRITDSTGETDYVQGGYRILVNEPGGIRWANPRKHFDNVRVEVEALKAAGPDNNDFGVLCRYRDSRNFYFGLISSDGYAGIGKVKDGRQTLISSDLMLKAPSVKPGSATNRLRLDCLGAALALVVNGQQAAVAIDPDLTDGDVGLIAGAFVVPGTDILFSSFIVRGP